jgi:hypothetical protein
LHSSAHAPQYFCCGFTPNGIGDLISQLQRLYNLGRSFGLEFVFRQLPRNRWSPELDESDFLGLAIGERRIEELPGHTIVTVDGAAASHALKEGRPLSSVLPAAMPSRAIIEFIHTGEMYSNKIPVPIRFEMDLRAKMIQRHGERVFNSGRADRLSVCVHIRQGDCTWVKRGEQYVFVGKRKITSNPDDVDIRRSPRVDDYAALLDAVTQRLGGLPFDLRVYSDGPASLFPVRSTVRERLFYELARREERLLDWSRIDRRGNPLQMFYNPMSDPEVRQEYEKVATALPGLVERYKNATLIVGTSGALTSAAILAFASADIVVLARNRWVFPLLGLGDPDNQAVLLLTSTVAENMERVEELLGKRVSQAGAPAVLRH